MFFKVLQNIMEQCVPYSVCNAVSENLKDGGKEAEEYDLILTVDLGALGSRILKDLTWEKGVNIQKHHGDCGEIIYKVIEDEFQGG